MAKIKKTPKCFQVQVDITKVNLEVIQRWIAAKIQEQLPDEDILVDYLYELLQANEKYPDIKAIHDQLTGFIGESESLVFCEKLWKLLISAQDDPDGIPAEILEKRKNELEELEQKGKKMDNREREHKASLHGRDNGRGGSYGEGRDGSYRDGSYRDGRDGTYGDGRNRYDRDGDRYDNRDGDRYDKDRDRYDNGNRSSDYGNRNRYGNKDGGYENRDRHGRGSRYEDSRFEQRGLRGYNPDLRRHDLNYRDAYLERSQPEKEHYTPLEKDQLDDKHTAELDRYTPQVDSPEPIRKKTNYNRTLYVAKSENTPKRDREESRSRSRSPKRG